MKNVTSPSNTKCRYPITIGLNPNAKCEIDGITEKACIVIFNTRARKAKPHIHLTTKGNTGLYPVFAIDKKSD